MKRTTLIALMAMACTGCGSLYLEKDPATGKTTIVGSTALSAGKCTNNSDAGVHIMPEIPSPTWPQIVPLPPGESHDCDAFTDVGCEEPNQWYKVPNSCHCTWDGERMDCKGWGCSWGTTGCVDQWGP